MSTLTGTATPVPQFDFDFKLDDPQAVTFNSGGVSWTMRDGTKIGGDTTASSPSTIPSRGVGADGSSSAAEASRGVSVFSCVSGSTAAQNAQKRAKGLVAIPGVLKTLGTTEYDGKIWIATERCVTLRHVVNNQRSFYSSPASSSSSSDSSVAVEQQDDEDVDEQSKFQCAVALGINSLATTLSGLHRNSLVHMNVNIDSVFVLPDSGEWRLFGFELCSDAASAAERTVGQLSSILPQHRYAPEFGGLGVGGAGGGAVSVSNVALADTWCLGMLMLEVFAPNAAPPKTVNDIRAPKSVPRAFLSTFNALVTPNVRARWTADKFRESSELLKGAVSPVVDLVIQLEELNLKNASERDTFYRELGNVVHHLPDKVAQGFLLPKIASMLQYGGSSAAALTPLLRIARRLPTPEAFAARVSAPLMSLFSSNEPIVRMMLLEHSEQYARMLPTQLVCEKVWPLYSQGLASKIPEMREQSVRALPNFAPVLTARWESGDVVKALLALQQDPVGAIRANSTLALAMMAKWIPEASRAKTVCNGLGRMLKDPYVPSRLAAVRALGSLASPAASHENGGTPLFDAKTLCEMLLPAVSPMLIDSDTNVREVATKTVQVLLSEAINSASQIPCTVAPPAPVATAASAASSSASTPTSHHQQPRPVTSSAEAPESRALPFASSRKVEEQPKPVAVSKPAGASLPSNDVWDDMQQTKSGASFSSAGAAAAVKRGFKPAGGGSGSVAAAAAASPASSATSASSVSSKNNNSNSTAEIEAIFGISAKPAVAAVLPAAVAAVTTVVTTEPDAEPLALSSSGGEIGGMKLAKRGFKPGAKR